MTANTTFERLQQAGRQAWWEVLPLLGLLGVMMALYGTIRLVGGPALEPLSRSQFLWGGLVPGALLLGVCIGWPGLLGMGKVVSTYEPPSWKAYTSRFLSLRQVLGLLLATLWWVLFIHFFDQLKALIPYLQPFQWDEVWMKLDYLLHGGHHPWRLLHGWIGDMGTVLIDRVYVSWYLVGTVILSLQFWNPDRKGRFRFLVAMALTWFVVGNVMATLMSSAGPVYYQEVVGTAKPFGPLMEQLESIHQNHHLYARVIQQDLWQNYLSSTSGQVGAIAAMPSMHVALAALFIPAGWRVHKVLGWIAVIYFLFILAGSVHLGWHYAIDGYVGGLVAWGIWEVVKNFQAWYWETFNLAR